MALYWRYSTGCHFLDHPVYLSNFLWSLLRKTRVQCNRVRNGR